MMHLTVELMDDCTLIRSHADFDAHLAAEIRDVFNEIISHIDRNVVLDLTHSSYLDSSGLGAIAFLHKRLNCMGFTLELIGLKEQPLRVINELQIDENIRCFSFDSLDLKPTLQAYYKKNA